jgi:hypothetical protein
LTGGAPGESLANYQRALSNDDARFYCLVREPSPTPLWERDGGGKVRKKYVRIVPAARLKTWGSKKIASQLKRRWWKTYSLTTDTKAAVLCRGLPREEPPLGIPGHVRCSSLTRLKKMYSSRWAYPAGSGGDQFERPLVPSLRREKAATSRVSPALLLPAGRHSAKSWPVVARLLPAWDKTQASAHLATRKLRRNGTHVTQSSGCRPLPGSSRAASRNAAGQLWGHRLAKATREPFAARPLARDYLELRARRGRISASSLVKSGGRRGTTKTKTPRHVVATLGPSAPRSEQVYGGYQLTG